MTLTADRLLAYLRDELGVDVTDVGPDTPLFSTGIIDSFALVRIIGYLEESCGLEIPAVDVTLDNLDSVARMLSYAERSNG